MKKLRLYKILKDNNITMTELARFLNISCGYLTGKCKLLKDFKIKELIEIKEFLVNKGIINEDYDYSDFLDLVENE